MASTTASITRCLSLLLLLLLLAVPSSSSYVKFDLHGNVHPVGHIYVTIKIGEPAKPYNLDVDTGSILTWLQCHDPNCRGNCRKWRQPHPYYELTPGKVLPRNNPLCQELHPVLGEQKCRYRINYAHGNSNGLLIRDKFTLPSRNAQQSIAFGCGYDQPGVPAPVDGILALGRGSSVTLVSQLKTEHAITKDVIIHCISTRGGGFFHFGEYEHSSSPITWVPIDRNTRYGHYTPIAKPKLHFGSSDGALISNNPITVTFDSGSTYTYFDPQTYKLIEDKVKDTLHRSLTRVHADDAMILCWKGPKKFRSIHEVKPLFKSIFLVFGQGTILEIPPENYLIISRRKNVCLGILPFDRLRQTAMILGDITMQDRIVIYDNERDKIGWAHHSC